MARILFVVTGASYWTLKDGTRHPTGYWAEEFAAPYSALSGARQEIVVATPGGVVPHVDVMSLRRAMAGSAQIAIDLEETLCSAEDLRRPIELADARLDDYDAVYYPGGHGPMEDRWKDADSGKLLIAALASGKPLAIVCHAPVAHPGHPTRRRFTLRGYRVTAFTNDEEGAVGLREGPSGRSRTNWSSSESTSPAARYGSPMPSSTAISSPARTPRLPHLSPKRF